MAKKLLIFGGTQFIGRAFVEHLLAENAEHDITLFNRGESNPTLFPDLKKIKGDRETADIDQVLAHDWDYIVDVNGYYPNSIERFIPKLKGKVDRYIYISTVSVYQHDYADKHIVADEDYPMLECTGEQREGDWSKFYGEKKAECERIIQSNDWLDTVILRPSIVYGKYDYTERFYYWLERVKKRDRILIPENGTERGNMTFVDDLVRMMADSLTIKEHRITYNAVTHPMNTLRKKLDTMAHVMGNTPEFVSLSTEQMKENDVRQPRDFPCSFGKEFLAFDISKVEKDFQFEFTPYEETIRRCADYHDSLGWLACSKGMSIETEDQLLSKYGN
jgi:2'-hydroxyisoflavone reductase